MEGRTEGRKEKGRNYIMDKSDINENGYIYKGHSRGTFIEPTLL